MIDFKLMKHQQDAIEKARTEPDIFLAFEQGTGKSCTTIQILRQKFAAEKRIMRTLILAPAVVLKNWKKEFDKFSKVPQSAIFVLDGPVKKRIEAIKKQDGFSAIFITNYDVMQDTDLIAALLHWGVEILVCDESHSLKSYKSKRAKAVALLADKCVYRYLLTGTPILNNAMDLYQQYKILNGYKGRDSTFGTNFFAFRGQYFVDKNQAWSSKPNHYPEWVPRMYAYEDMMRRIGANTLRVTKTECLDLPDLVVQNLEVSISPQQKRLYEDMRDEFIAWIDSERNRGTETAVVARLAVTKALRLQQIISGFVKTDTGEVIRITPNPRLDALRDLLETLTPGHKVIVWACFKENYAMIREVCEELKIKTVELHGETAPQDRQRAVDSFENDPDVRLFLANPGAGGVGITIVQASYSIYYSRSFNLAHDLQSEARNHRRGSEIHEKITRINLVAPNSIDEIIAEALGRKVDVSNQIIGRLNDL